LQLSRHPEWRTPALHRLIPADLTRCDAAENPGICVAQVTAGTRCYTVRYGTRLQLSFVVFIPNPHQERAFQHRDVFVGGMPVRRNLSTVFPMGKSGAPYWRSLARMTSARTARMIEKNPITPST
jgi:hypothetical protein